MSVQPINVLRNYFLTGEIPTQGNFGDLLDTIFQFSAYTGNSITLSGTTPIIYSAGTISIQQATSGQSGYLTFVDWNTFNNKITSFFGRTGTTITPQVNDYSFPQISGTLSSNQLLIGSGLSFSGNILSVTGGSVNLSGQTPIIYSSGTISILQATSGQSGYLSSIDWSNFNNKITSVFGRTGNTIIAQTNDYNFSQISGNVLSNQLLIGTGLTFSGNTLITTGLTPSFSASTPLNYSNNQLSILQATSGQSGYLSSIDWNTLNNKQSSITLTITGTSGASSFINNILNVPTYTLNGLGGVSASFFSGATPITYNNVTGIIGIQQATSGQSGFISSIDWNTFNNKQGTISLTITGTSGAATFISNTLNIPQYQYAIQTGNSTNQYINWNGSQYVPNQIGFSQLSGTPTTLSGYGITNAYTTAQSDGRYFQINNNLSEIQNKFTSNTNLGTFMNQDIAVTSTYTITSGVTGKILEVSASTTAITLTLDSTTLVNGFKCVVRKNDSSSNLVIISGNPNPNTSIAIQGHALVIWSDGVTYYTKAWYGGYDSAGNLSISNNQNIYINTTGGTGNVYINSTVPQKTLTYITTGWTTGSTYTVNANYNNLFISGISGNSTVVFSNLNDGMTCEFIVDKEISGNIVITLPANITIISNTTEAIFTTTASTVTLTGAIGSKYIFSTSNKNGNLITIITKNATDVSLTPIKILYATNTQVTWGSVSGSTNSDVIVSSISVPVGSMGTNSTMRITYLVSRSADTNSTTFKIWDSIGSTSGLISSVFINSSGTTASQTVAYLMNNNALNSQKKLSGSALSTMNLDFSVQRTINFSINITNTSQSVAAFESIIFEILN